MKQIGFSIFYGFAKVLAMLPLRILYILSDMLYPIVYYIVKYRKRVIFENLRNSFPEKSEKEIEVIAKKFYRHFCDLFVEIFKLMHISEKEIKKRVVFTNPEVFEQEFQNNKHILSVVAHYNNWELGIAIGLQSKHIFASIYQPLQSKNFDQLMIKIRTQFGGIVVPMKKTARTFAQQMQEKKLTQFIFIADQSPYPTEIQYWTTFLNQDTPVHLGVEKLARATRQPVYFLKAKKIRRGYNEVTAIKLCDDCSLLQPNELTELHVRELEKTIREAPQYWLWSHRRWKVKRQKL